MRAVERWGYEAARRVGRGDQERGFSLLALSAAAAYFVSLFLPWAAFNSGWNFRPADDAGLLALALVLGELLRLVGGWVTRGSSLIAFSLTTAVGIMGVTTWATLRWGSGPVSFQAFRYGFWLAFVFAVLLVGLGALRLASVRGSIS